MSTQDNKISFLFKLDNLKDGILYDVFSITDEKTNLLKNALFYYINAIEQGKIVDRCYPYNKVNIKIDILPKDDIDTNLKNIIKEMFTIGNQQNNNYSEIDDSNTDFDF